MLDEIDKLAWNYLTVVIFSYYPFKRADIEQVKFKNDKPINSPERPKKSMITYVNFVKHGPYCGWYKNGQLEYRGSYLSDQEHGECVQYNQQGILIAQYNFVNGNRVGWFKTWSDSGKPLSAGKYNGRSNTKIYEIYDGKIKHWHENGKLKSIDNYRNGLREGFQYSWYSDGALMSKTYYICGKTYGYKKEWFSNGQLKSIQYYMNDMSHGIAKTFHLSGKLASKCHFKLGDLHGILEYWDADGKLKYRSTYVDGDIYGLHEEWLDHYSKLFYFGDSDIYGGEYVSVNLNNIVQQ